MTDLEETKKALNKILKTMDVPPMRMNDMGWLQRNLGVKNNQHPDFQEAMNLIRDFQQGMRCHMMFDGNP